MHKKIDTRVVLEVLVLGGLMFSLVGMVVAMVVVALTETPVCS